ncbi:hypothetical protein FRC05_000660 [Tulasnella sp. 425]|nr:hypothetical protein FRC05_000660 [Tulasnella sp. 425]
MKATNLRSNQKGEHGAFTDLLGRLILEVWRLITRKKRQKNSLTHGPPHGIHDETLRGELVGCPTLLAYLARLRPRLHVFGHIHEARGATIHSWDTESAIGAEEGQEREDRNRNTSTVFVNPANQPIGAKATKSGRWLKTGSEGWTPIIVDIRD